MIEDTIVAPATPPGRGGVAILRLSGPSAYPIALQITRHTQLSPRTAQFCQFYTQALGSVDEGIVLYFAAPHSFTGEDIVEFQVHGSPVVLDILSKECVAKGARLAKPGEFSQRAFLNNKIDLTQAEAIADLIQSSSETASRMAMRSLQGDFSKQINAIVDEIIQLRMYTEAAIDFPEEEVDFLTDGKVMQMLEAILSRLKRLRANACQGVIFREGVSVVIAGPPNAGKSTLINRLAGKDIAIVTSVPGTTRDVMREYILLDDVPLHIVDTAGLRASNDIVEQEGIKRAWQEVRNADCVLLVRDINEMAANNLEDTLGAVERGLDTSTRAWMSDQQTLETSIQAEIPKNTPILLVYNKIDTVNQVAKQEENKASVIGSPPIHSNALPQEGKGIRWGGPMTNAENKVYISAKSGEGLSLLKEKIKTAVGFQPTEGQFLARRRHLNAIDDALFLVDRGQQQLVKHRAGELLAEDLRMAHHALEEITGKFSSDDLLGKIFSSFCIGK